MVTVETRFGLNQEEWKMKKNNLFVTLAAALTAGIVFFSCNKVEDKLQPQVPSEQEATSAYTLTVEAVKGSATKALADAGTTLTSSWAAGDNVDVYNASDVKLGTLTPAVSSTSTTTLSGDLTSAPAVGDVLTLKFLAGSYASQDGTLDYIATHCDYATATVTVTAVAGLSITTTPAHFVSQQAIVKFTLKKPGDETLPVNQFLLNNGTTTYTVTPSAAATSTLYVAIPALAAQTVTLSASAADGYYDLTKTGVSFDNGSFYRIEATLNKQPISSLFVTGLDSPSPQSVTYEFGGVSAGSAL